MALRDNPIMVAVAALITNAHSPLTDRTPIEAVRAKSKRLLAKEAVHRYRIIHARSLLCALCRMAC